MPTDNRSIPSQRKLTRRTEVVVIGGSAGNGLETARRARPEGAEVVHLGRDPQRSVQPARRPGARGPAAFDATDPASLACRTWKSRNDSNRADRRGAGA